MGNKRTGRSKMGVDQIGDRMGREKYEKKKSESNTEGAKTCVPV